MAKQVARALRDRGFYTVSVLSMILLCVAYAVGVPPTVFVNIGDQGDQYYIQNFYEREQGAFPFRWTKESSSIRIPGLKCMAATISLAAAGARPEGERLPTVTILGGGTVLAEFVVQSEIGRYDFAYSPPSLCLLPGDLILQIRSDVFVPAGGDPRALGILLNTVEVTPTAGILSPALLPVFLTVSLIGGFSVSLCYFLLRHLELSQRLSLLCCLVLLGSAAVGMAWRLMPPVHVLVYLFLVPALGCGMVGILQYFDYWQKVVRRLRLVDESVTSVGWRKIVESSTVLRMSTRSAIKAHIRSVPMECWLLLAICLGSRLTNLTLLPVFCDEGMYVSFAQRLWVDPFAGLRAGVSRLGLCMLVAIFRWLSTDPLLAARLALVFTGTLSMLGLYVVGKQLYSRRIGAMAALLYIISPLMLFHDRMVLADVLVNTCGIYTLLFGLIYLRRGGLKYAVGLGVAMGLGMLSKLTGVFLLFTPLAVCALVIGMKTSRLARRLALPYFVAGLVISPVLLHPMRAKALTDIGLVGVQTLGISTASEWLEVVTRNLTAVLSQVGAYITTPVLLMCGLSLLLILLLRNREGGLLWVLGVLPVLALAGSSRGFLPPRYFLFATSPLLICAAWCIEQVSRGVNWLADRVPMLSERRLSPIRNPVVMGTLLVAGLSLSSVRLDYYILADPSRAPLPPVDKEQYITGWPSGYGIPEAVGWLEKQSVHKQIQVVASGSAMWALRMYLDEDPRITIVEQNIGEAVSSIDRSSETFFVANPPWDRDFAVLNPGAKLLARYPKPGGQSAIEIYSFP
jgi:hypothetical protein